MNIHLAAISGSLRKGSFNTMLLNEALQLLPKDVTFEVAKFDELPLFNGDLDVPPLQEFIPSVKKFREVLAKADGFIIASPEYNFSIPGPLKNAIDWASRGDDSPLLNKPVALMGASTGMAATTRMQIAFLAVFHALNMQLVHEPEVLIANAKEKFDEDGKLKDEEAKKLIQQQLNGLKTFIEKCKKTPY